MHIKYKILKREHICVHTLHKSITYVYYMDITVHTHYIDLKCEHIPATHTLYGVSFAHYTSIHTVQRHMSRCSQLAMVELGVLQNLLQDSQDRRRCLLKEGHH